MTNLVEVNNEQVVTTSLVVAETFGKRHNNVMRDIEGLLKNEHTQKLFQKGTYIHSQNKQEYPLYYMNKDGFTLLAMGFTGKDAIEFKMKYINAFNEMEEHIKATEAKVHSYMIDDPIARAELWITEHKEKIMLEEKVKEYTPKVKHYEDVMSSENLLTTTAIAKGIGMSARDLNATLHKLGVQFKMGNQWHLYSKYDGKGYTKSVTSLDPQGKFGTEGATHVYTKWTFKGREFIYDILRENGVIE